MAAPDLATLGHASAVAQLQSSATAASARVWRGSAWTAVVTGVASNTHNGVISEPGLDPTSPEVDAVVAELAATGLPSSWLVAGPADEVLTARLVDLGAQPERTGWWAGAPLDAVGPFADGRPAVDVRVEVVTTGPELDAWLDVAGGCGWLDDDADRAARRRLYLELGLDEERDLVHWVAWRGSEPVGMASGYLGVAGVLDLCNLAVVDTERRRGVGAALARAHVDAGRGRGAMAVVAGLSPDGWALYRTLGLVSAPVEPDRCFYLP